MADSADLEVQRLIERPTHALDLPQLYQRPPPNILLSTLASLKWQPPSWKLRDVRTAPEMNGGEIQGLASYLTSIIASPLKWIPDDDQKEAIWEAASLRITERSGRTGMSSMTRDFEIHTAQIDVTIRLHEPALTADNLGLKTWASSYLLSQRLHAVPLPPSLTQERLRVLELGAGTGLVGLSAAVIFGAAVHLTDLPTIVPNLQENIARNVDLIQSYNGSVTSAILDWSRPSEVIFSNIEDSDSDGSDSSSHTGNTPQYPLILVADPIYSIEHPSLLVNALSYWLSRHSDSRILLEVPLRSGYQAERDLLRMELDKSGFQLLHEDVDIGRDDWGSGAFEEDGLVQCWFSAWAWKDTASQF